ncbi:MFS transporter [Streptomyces sp. NRRL S-1521]|uniref:MFS transporter n=1 Tax=Streptomyces sp. NRRL S-1521 TaxID=1609100 RepID=UPI00099EED55|nr:MFS transporter [Streptomyces sp. NRRL S-1521]
MTGDVEARPLRALSPWTIPGFRRFLGGLSLDLIGDQVWFLALAWAASDVGGPQAAGLVVAAGSVPRMLFMLWMGSLVDRVSALRVAQVAQVARSLVMAATCATAATGKLPLIVLTVSAVAFGIADAARLPAAGAIPGLLLPTEVRVRGQGLVQACARLALVVSGPMAGVALAVGGLSVAAGANLALFLTAFLSFRGLRTHLAAATADPQQKSSVRAGLKYVRGQPPLVLALITATFLNLALLGPLNIGVVLRSETAGWGSGSLGIVFGVFGAASVLGGVMSARIATPARPILSAAGWMAVSSVGFIALGFTDDPVVTGSALALSGFSLGPAAARLTGFLQAITPRGMLGRVMALASFSTFGLTPVALSAFGFLAAKFGLDVAFIVSGICCLVTGLIAACFPLARRPMLHFESHAKGVRL